MNWAQRRKLTYIALVVAFFGIIAFGIYYKVSSAPVSCTDNRKNGDEQGVDCGGSCNMYCPNQLANPVVQWVRAFPVTPGVVQAVAYIQHSNPTSAARAVNYEFKLYDENNNILATRTGTTYLGTAGNSAIVESLIQVSGTVSVARFAFTSPAIWQKVSPLFSQAVILTDRNSTERFDGNTRLTAILQNKSRLNFSNMEVVAIFYDKDGNAITASKAVLPSLPALQSSTAYFTWPYPVNGIARTEIIPRFNPFTTEEL
ncbi:MAG: hypothetical protein V4478_03525 [Patescibacteria group bacterium]